jgi:hypothetical protein
MLFCLFPSAAWASLLQPVKTRLQHLLFGTRNQGRSQTEMVTEARDRRRREQLGGFWNSDPRKCDFQRFERHLQHIYFIKVMILIKELKKTKNILLMKFYRDNCLACLIVATALEIIPLGFHIKRKNIIAWRLTSLSPLYVFNLWLGLPAENKNASVWKVQWTMYMKLNCLFRSYHLLKEFSFVLVYLSVEEFVSLVDCSSVVEFQIVFSIHYLKKKPLILKFICAHKLCSDLRTYHNVE